jgi:hypothetical protein
LNDTRIVLAETLKTSATWRGDVCAPVGAAHGAIRFGSGDDPAIDHWDEMGIREEVEDGPRPWSINTAEQDVAFDRRLVPVRFDTELMGLDPWL